MSFDIPLLSHTFRRICTFPSSRRVFCHHFSRRPNCSEAPLKALFSHIMLLFEAARFNLQLYTHSKNHYLPCPIIVCFSASNWRLTKIVTSPSIETYKPGSLTMLYYFCDKRSWTVFPLEEWFGTYGNPREKVLQPQKFQKFLPVLPNISLDLRCSVPNSYILHPLNSLLKIRVQLK